jgi:hypothetical protein
MSLARRGLAAALLCAALPARAQSPWAEVAPRLWRPARIRLELDTSLANRDFVPLLAAELAAMFTAEVAVGKVHLDLDDHRRPNGQVDAGRLLPAGLRELAWTSSPGTVHVQLIGEDLVLGAWNYAFAASNGDLDRQIGLVVVSLFRMATRPADGPEADDWPGLTAARAQRLAAKNIVRSVGYRGGDACILATPMDLVALTHMADDFCDPERAHLEAAGILRPRR